MKKVVAFGTFDPLHKGHKSFLKQAKDFGYLIVVVSRDDKIEVEKNRKPREKDVDRADRVRNLKIADEVILSESGDSYNLLATIKPDIISLGYDQKVPEPLKKEVKKYKIVTLKAFKPEVYKSSLIKAS